MDIKVNIQKLPKIELDRLKIKVLFTQALAVQFGSMMVAAFFLFMFKNKLSPMFMKLWGAAFIALILSRMMFQRYFVKHYLEREKSFTPVKWENLFTLTTFGSGCLWGVAIWFGFASGDIAADALLGFIITGVTAAAAVAYVTSIRATHAFMIPCFVLLFARFVIAGSDYYYGMAGMTAVYAVLFSRITAKFYDYAVSNLSYGFQKDVLIDKIRSMQSQVTQTAKMAALGEMARGMGHEINNPLTIIQGSIDQIEDILKKEKDPVPEKLIRLMGFINKSIKRISYVIAELRTFAGSNTQENLKKVGANELVEQALDFCAEKFRKNGIAIEIIKPEGPLNFDGKPMQMVQVLLNLLNNSFDALTTLPDKWIKIEIIDMGEYVDFAVMDSGPGIPEEFHNKLMRPFFSTKETGKNLGLGLSVCKGIVESHGGRIMYDAQSPHTRFIVSLPKVFEINTSRAA